MARKLYAPQPLPAHYDRRTLSTPEPIKFRLRKCDDAEGRGMNWVKGNLYGFDHHVVDKACAIVYTKEGGWRTLNPELFEWKL